MILIAQSNIIQISQMIYPMLGSVLSGSLAFYLGYTTQKKSQVISTQQQPKDNTFSRSTIDHYIQRKKQQNKFIIYSHLHKCKLSTHQYLNNTIIKSTNQLANKQNNGSKDQNQKQNAKQLDSISIAKKQNDDLDVKLSQTIQQETSQIVTKKLYQKIFKSYGNELIKNDICQSVELIYGPIFSKDTPYKPTKQQTVKNVYVSNIKISKSGQYLTDRNYTIVVCNSKSGSYYNAFSYRKSGYDKFKLLNYLTSIKKIQEQTGLIFDLKGTPLIQHDYQGLSKQRLFSDP